MIRPALIILPVLVFTAFLLLLLVTLSVPIINSIYLFRLTANLHSDLYGSGVSEWADFGVWGYCLSGKVQSEYMHILYVITQAFINVGLFSSVGIDAGITELCSDVQLGYTIDDTVAEALNATDLNHTISSATSAALVLHPIVTGLIFGTLLLSFFAIWRRSKNTSRTPVAGPICVGYFVAFLTTAVFLIDVIMVTIIRNIVYDNTDGIHVKYGNAVWMVLGAALAMWLSCFSACFAYISLRARGRPSPSRRTPEGEREKADAIRIGA